VAARLAERIVAIGSSTGGVEALQEIICALPPTSPAILVAQHMPPHFTTRLASRLNAKSAVRVVEAEEGQLVTPGFVYIAPGDRHLRLGRWGKSYICRVSDDPLVGGHRPSVDVLFRSVARAAGAQAVGVILTGMGCDGAKGLLEMREAGAHTIGQDQATCVVYGMPKAAAALGATESEVPIEVMAARIIELCS
jgi:two-component system chemotaxis response regulator CheB